MRIGQSGLPAGRAATKKSQRVEGGGLRMMDRRALVKGIAILSLLGFPASAQDTVKVGLVHSMTGGLAPVGKQIMAGVRPYIARRRGTGARPHGGITPPGHTTPP